MTSAYDMFYGGTSGGGEKGFDAVYKFIVPGFINDIKNVAVDKMGAFIGVIVAILLLVVFMILVAVAGSWIRMGYQKITGGRLLTRLMAVSGFEGYGAAVAGLQKQTHLGSLDGLKYAQDKTQRDRFSAGSETPVFWNAPSYVLRKDELLNNAMGDYGREKASGATTMSFADWMSLNSSRYSTFGESANNLAALGKGIARQNLDREGVRREGMTPSLANRTLSTASMMGLY